MKLNLVIKVTDLCNFDCTYCTQQKSGGIVSVEMIKVIYEKIAVEYQKCNIIWHGGEPLLAGIDFFRTVVQMQEKFATVKFKNHIQTNLVLFNDEFAKFFSENNVTVSGSFDGCWNDSTRGHTNEILAAVKTLQKYQGKVGVVCVVAENNLQQLKETYDDCKRLKVNLKLSEEFGSKNNLPLWVFAYKDLYDYYKQDESTAIKIDPFDDIEQMLIKGRGKTCVHQGCLGEWLAVDSQGDIYPCNRMNVLLGNIVEYEKISSVFVSHAYNELIKSVILRIKKCISCHVFDLCRGGCSHRALTENGLSEINGSSCLLFKDLFTHIKNKQKIKERDGVT